MRFFKVQGEYLENATCGGTVNDCITGRNDKTIVRLSFAANGGSLVEYVNENCKLWKEVMRFLKLCGTTQ